MLRGLLLLSESREGNPGQVRRQGPQGDLQRGEIFHGVYPHEAVQGGRARLRIASQTTAQRPLLPS